VLHVRHRGVDHGLEPDRLGGREVRGHGHVAVVPAPTTDHG
jgi:hypothetical protein